MRFGLKKDDSEEFEDEESSRSNKKKKSTDVTAANSHNVFASSLRSGTVLFRQNLA